MAFVDILIQKEKDNYFWVNAYRLLAEDVGSAGASLNDIIAAERTMHSTLVHFTQARISLSPDPSRQNFQTVIIDLQGQRVIDSNKLAGATTVLSFAIQAASGRPGKKHYRYCLSEDWISGRGDGYAIDDLVAVGTATGALQTLITVLTSSGTPLVIGDTHKLAEPSCSPKVTSVKTHHGWFNRNNGLGPTVGG